MHDYFSQQQVPRIGHFTTQLYNTGKIMNAGWGKDAFRISRNHHAAWNVTAITRSVVHEKGRLISLSWKDSQVFALMMDDPCSASYTIATTCFVSWTVTAFRTGNGRCFCPQCSKSIENNTPPSIPNPRRVLKMNWNNGVVVPSTAFSFS